MKGFLVFMGRYLAMTVDVDPPFSSSQNFIIEKGVISLLDLLDHHAIKATFFLPAVVAQNFQEIIGEIVSHDHEIACHGLKHHPEEGMLNLSKQVQMIRTATKIIESVTGVRPVGFRAPLFRANRNCWIALQKNGYIYDSSVIGFPRIVKRRTCFQTRPFYIKVCNSFTVDKNIRLLELPVSTNPFLPFPLGGGWFRIFGLKWAKIGMKINLNSQTPTVFYIHPKDVVEIQTPKLFWYNYRNTANGLRMLDDFIKYAKTCTIEFLKAHDLIKIAAQKICFTEALSLQESC